ncbi:hypothetical protein HPB52_009043 [Rhipicephalus sanguineus]|uniref:Fatty acid hydroxylase domain-containing protein n=1 Tax=Rhipicephalus sanguineus TaxID=34632 RepID=A0A9D4Q5Q3_RHISA|nr:hypothetical protein HPB52_009043 [Rhipicephalus sanguineus]
MTKSPPASKLAPYSTACNNTVVARVTRRLDRKQRYVILGSLLSWAALLAVAYIWGPSTVRLMKSSGEALRATLDLNFKKTVYFFRGDYFILTAGVVRQVVFNQVFVQLPVNVLFYWLKDLRGFDRSLRLPPLSRAVAHFACFVAIEEVLFYYSHRLLHHRLLYQRFHKKHHEWTAPVAITAVYCTPLEHLLSNVLPVVVGPALLGSHLSVHWLWAVLTAPYGVIVHSGYHLPLLPSPQMHDFHHLMFRGNYGILGILDWLHGTDGAFRQSEAYQRHRLLLSFRPVHELYPDTGRRDLLTERRPTTQPHG